MTRESESGNRGRLDADTAALRAALFTETPAETAQRVLLGTFWSLRPKRLGNLVPLAKLWLADLVNPSTDLPALGADPGRGEFAGMVRDLSVPTLLKAYARGLFPKGHFGPLKWMSPAERCVLFPGEFHMPKRLRRLMRQDKYNVTFDTEFERVMKACAAKRDGRWHVTWITPSIMSAYAALYDEGHAHSFEVWNEGGVLVGGGYGVAVGGVFFTESQFSLEPNTSKLGFSVLNWHLAKWGYVMNDGKRPTPTILDLGFRIIPRDEFLRCLVAGTALPGQPGRWTVEAGPKQVADLQPGTPLREPSLAATAEPESASPLQAA